MGDGAFFHDFEFVGPVFEWVGCVGAGGSVSGHTCSASQPLLLHFHSN